MRPSRAHRTPPVPVAALLAGSILLGSSNVQGDGLAAPGRLELKAAPSVIQLRWTNGVLQKAASLADPQTWVDAIETGNPMFLSTPDSAGYFRLRSASPGRIGGTMATRGHPLHREDFQVLLNGSPWPLDCISPSGEVDMTSHMPGRNRLEFLHDWYLPLSVDTLLAEGGFVTVEELVPTYLGKQFRIGEARTRLVGHGGGSRYVGFDTYAACSDGRLKGLWMLEIDVLISGDGVPFLSHDWGSVTALTGLQEGAGSDALTGTGKITLLEEVLRDFSHLILDLIHNNASDVAAIVNYMETNHPERIRNDVYLQVCRPADYSHIRDTDPAIKLSYNLASWSAWGLTTARWSTVAPQGPLC